jgi:5-methylcytosine-specific restriction endonuclease McrA
MALLPNRNVLVLNKLWTAIGIATLERAISLLYSEEDGLKAQVITPPPLGAYETYTWADWARLKPEEGEDVMVAPQQVLRIPQVILLSNYDGMPQRQVKFSRRYIHKRDNYQCQYCGCRPGTEELTIDHVVPRAQGGETSWTNCVLACMPCNTRKANRTPKEARMKLLKEPVKPEFSLFKGTNPNKVLATWKHWLSEAYWNIPLQNDMGEDA